MHSSLQRYKCSKTTIISLLVLALADLLTAQGWTPPVNLGIAGVDDENPQACRICVPQICLVWQAYINNNWEIFTRTINGSYHSDTMRVNNNPASDINPSSTYDEFRSCFWCAWQSNRTGNWDIYAARQQSFNSWAAPSQLTNDSPGDARPSITFVSQTQSIPRILLEEHFEGTGIPANWTVVDGNNDNFKWTVGTTIDIGPYAPPNYGTKYAYYSDDDAGSVLNNNEELISPVIYVGSGFSSLQLTYDYGFNLYQAGEKYRVKFRKKTGSTWSLWVNIAEYTASGSGSANISLSSYLPADSVQLEWFYSDSTSSSHWGYACACDNVVLKTSSNAANTIWVVWQKTTGSNTNIYYSVFNGTSWSPALPITNDIYPIININPRISVSGAPYAVWQRNQDIYYSRFWNGAWEPPQAVTTDPANDSLPEIVSQGRAYFPASLWILWQSNRDGNWEIYRTGDDTLNIAHRVTFSDSADMNPSGVHFVIPIRQFEPWLLFSSNRNGNSDVFVDGYGGQYAVDTNHAVDKSPVMAIDDNDYYYLWAFWQTNRNGDWDICGSYFFITGGIAENGSHLTPNAFRLFPNPGREFVSINISGDAGMQRCRDAGLALEIYDACGRIVKSLSRLPNNLITWHCDDDYGRRVPTGVYFVRLKVDNQEFIEKVVILR